MRGEARTARPAGAPHISRRRPLSLDGHRAPAASHAVAVIAAPSMDCPPGAAAAGVARAAATLLRFPFPAAAAAMAYIARWAHVAEAEGGGGGHPLPPPARAAAAALLLASKVEDAPVRANDIVNVVAAVCAETGEWRDAADAALRGVAAGGADPSFPPPPLTGAPYARVKAAMLRDEGALLAALKHELVTDSAHRCERGEAGAVGARGAARADSAPPPPFPSRQLPAQLLPPAARAARRRGGRGRRGQRRRGGRRVRAARRPGGRLSGVGRGGCGPGPAPGARRALGGGAGGGGRRRGRGARARRGGLPAAERLEQGERMRECERTGTVRAGPRLRD